jgi:hypothetical protein
VVLLGLGAVRSEARGARPAGQDEIFQVRLGQGRDVFLVGQAVRGADRRLADSRCQAVFADFTDPSGRTLQQILDEQGQTGQGRLRLLMFYDGAQLAGCRAPGVLAFTQPGSSVVYVCSTWFREAFELNPARVEAVIIHESLHSLGLGENPPASHEITARVLSRCNH